MKNVQEVPILNTYVTSVFCRGEIPPRSSADAALLDCISSCSERSTKLHMTACTPIGYLGGQEGMKFYSEKYNFWIVYHYQVFPKTFSWKNEYKIFFRLEDMAQNGPEYPTCVSNSGKNLFPLKIQDNHALLQPKLVFLGSLAIWDDSNRYCFHKIIRLLQNAAKCCKNAAK